MDTGGWARSGAGGQMSFWAVMGISRKDSPTLTIGTKPLSIGLRLLEARSLDLSPPLHQMKRVNE